MKKILALMLALLMLVTCLVACDGTDKEHVDSDTDASAPVDTGDAPATPSVDPASVSLFVGYAREDITPPKDLFSELTLAGYAEGRPIFQIESTIHASCTAFRDTEGDVALIYTLDLHAISPAQALSIANEITKVTNVPKNNIILNVTHNHAAPGISTGNNYWNQVLIPGIVSAAEAAIADLKPCTALFAGEVDMTYYSFVRRYLTAGGSLYGVGAGGSDTIIAHESKGDPMIPVARFVRDGGKDVILVNFAAHCDTVSGRAKNSLAADYVDAFRRVIEHELDAHFSMQLGATGDINPMTRLPGEPSFYSTTDSYGRNLGYRLIEELKKLPQLEIKGDVEAKASNVRVEVDHSTDHLLEEAKEINDLYYGSNDKRPAEELMKEYGISTIYEAMYISSRANRGQYERRNISAVSIGNIVFAAADYEMFSHTGRNIKDGGNEHFDLTFMCAYSNGMTGYIPADYAFDNGGYEVYSCPYVRGSAEAIEAKLIEIINELSDQ